MHGFELLVAGLGMMPLSPNQADQLSSMKLTPATTYCTVTHVHACSCSARCGSGAALWSSVARRAACSGALRS